MDSCLNSARSASSLSVSSTGTSTLGGVLPVVGDSAVLERRRIRGANSLRDSSQTRENWSVAKGIPSFAARAANARILLTIISCLYSASARSFSFGLTATGGPQWQTQLPGRPYSSAHIVQSLFGGSPARSCGVTSFSQ